MRKSCCTTAMVLMLSSALFAQTKPDRNVCGMQQYYETMAADNPASMKKLIAQKASLQATANYYLDIKEHRRAARTTTTTSPVPVVFHILVDSAQYYALGGTAGIAKRCDSQIAVLNRDFNRQNYDSIMIPGGWKSLYGNTGIQFGLAHVDPNGYCSPGYEVMIIPGDSLADAGFNDSYDAFKQAKTVSYGLVAWDVTRYYNVWCFNINGPAASMLGMAVSKATTLASGSSADEVGVVINYNVLGSTGPTNIPAAGTGDSTGWLFPFNLGRPLTHMTGHFFEIWHPGGDDGGQCPWAYSGSACLTGVGSDDGLSDTPPQSNMTSGDPVYTISGGTIYDCCMMDSSVNMQPVGIACLSYMDGTNDEAMHLFTPMQAAAMAAMVLIPPVGDSTGATGTGTIGESYSLTQNPDLLGGPCYIAGVVNLQMKEVVAIAPNPSRGVITISVNSKGEILNNIVVIDLMGQQVAILKGRNKDYYSIDLSGLSKGIYFVKCNFASGSVTRKILLQ